MKKSAVVASILLMISIGFVPIVMVSCSNEILVYTVRFDSQGGNDIEPIEALKNSKLTEPSNPSRTGYEFGGWYKDNSYSERWVFSRDMVRSDMTLYAKWNAHTYAVTYNGNAQSTGTAPPTQTKKHGESLTLSTNSGTLERNGYRFGGWNTQADGFGTNYESGTLYETDAEILLYAKWINEEYNVTLYKQGGNGGSDSIKATYDSAMPLATAPIKNGYLFDGYYDQIDGGTQYYSSTMVSSKVWDKDGSSNLYAKWTPAYTVIFNSQEGSSVSSLEGVRQGSRIGEPAAPTRNGYAFDGWFKDSSCVAAWDFDVETINSNITLYAAWRPKITVNFNSQEGSIPIPESIVVTPGDEFGILPVTKRNGYTFDGWWTGENGTGVRIFSTMVVSFSSNQTLYAKWRMYQVGGIGQAGGYVFYDKKSYSNGWRYLEAAPYDWSSLSGDPTYVFGYYKSSENFSMVGTETAIGSGEENTEALVSAMGSEAYESTNGDGLLKHYAAKVCDEYSITKEGDIYNDWFLPSKDELNLMFANLESKNLGGFLHNYYWSSSEAEDAYSAWYQYFGNGDQDCGLYRGSGLRIRPVRAF